MSKHATKGWFRCALDRVGIKGGGDTLNMRRWESAKTSRLNSGHWGRAKDQWINLALIADLETLRTRCTYEAANNPFVDGVINTYTTDLVGKIGPLLQVKSSDEAFNERVEQAFRQWWKHCDANNRDGGVENLRLWGESLWKAGEFLVQFVNGEKVEGGVTLKIKTLNARQLYTPMLKSASNNIMAGVERDKDRAPSAYYIGKEPIGELDTEAMLDSVRVPAKDIIHGYKRKEPDQARGVPWLASSLQCIADMRDYDEQVLDCARSAADQGVLLQNAHPEAPYVEVDESVSIERRLMTTLPPGYTAFQIKSEQPATTYISFREERQREIGRPVCMPLMIVRLDSNNHNYSSARFDAQRYDRYVGADQAWIERIALNRIVDEFINEAVLARIVPPRPADVEFFWTWPTPPHVDPEKEAKASKLMLETNITTLRDECAARGHDYENVLEQRIKEKQMLKDAGFPEASAKGTGSKEEEENDEDEKAKPE